ncbi:alcohol dehydrogenase GroES-like domain-containing protein [Microdochium trichocladiopsis]|uniref:Alcohol dehydrogenase GroES-like domain-containing protein n=1 Tax=Microdochium trichocladiopsis TaxID=1682393 RepID=A0A9P8XVR3_9PEZI|nr:alcohol dehydrogenase GroES-like domain-containing protein [Microdochium trichocladiopsis]KAH7020826.1 alcohol dehydrogenase GroES-like domain-containing protein [Microdochium trichocladiopsis]
MATSQLAYAVEKAIGHDGSAATHQDVTSFTPGKTGKNETMKALCWMGKNDVQVRDVARPKILEDTDAILKVTGSTVCGSDLHLLHGVVMQMTKGDILGHEFMGVVDEVGSAIKRVQIGKRYVSSFQFACGGCFYCKQKLSSMCERTNSNKTMKFLYGNQTGSFAGYSHLTGGFAGGQAEYVRVPFGDVNLLEIPDSVPEEKALYLSDVVSTSYNAVHDTGVYKGDKVAVFGCGPIGHMAAVFALKAGAAKIILVDTEPRLSFVKSRWPAEHKDKLEIVDYKKLSFGLTKKPTVVSRLNELCDGRGPDVALECAAGEYSKGWFHWLQLTVGLETDTSEIVNEMVESVRPFGRCGITGVYLGYSNQVNLGALMEKGVRLIGNGQAPVQKYWEELLKQIENGELDPLQMVSHRVRLEDIDKVYYKFEKREESMQKVFVETKFSPPPCKGSPPLKRY